MKPKSIVSAVLLLFVAASVVYLVASESTLKNGSRETKVENAGTPAEPTKPQSQPSEALAEVEAPKHKLVAYYFHGDFRCKTCLAMERFAYEALDGGLSDELESGRLEWKAVNVDTPGNEHFDIDFGLTSSALVLVNTVGDERKEWKDLQRIWDLVGDESKFKDYVRNEVVAYLENE
jgi:hypothetical protein